MKDLLVIVPSRGRPHNIAALREAWAHSGATADLIIGVDDDDPTLDAYKVDHADLLDIGPRQGMNGTLNRLAAQECDNYRYLGFLGDDHSPKGDWEPTILDALRSTPLAIVYGNDLIQGPNLPTAVFLDALIVRTLGYIAPPALRHLRLDDTWKLWGERLGTLRYLPEVIIEHVHPLVGKAPSDAGYEQVNSAEMWAHDNLAFDDYRATRLDIDIAMLKAL